VGPEIAGNSTARRLDDVILDNGTNLTDALAN
jgi:hypothetical protein